MTADQERRILQRFGLNALRPGQRELLAHALAGRSALGVLPTGHGKSLVYQAAAALLGGVSVVISPLIALMRDQCAALAARGISAARFDSTLTPEQRAEVLQALRSGSQRLLYLAPEALQSPELDDALRAAPLSLFVVDEAHCVSQWGHSFRPDYLQLPLWYRRYAFRSLLALTATATPPVQRDLCATFDIPREAVVALPPDRPNIERRVLPTAERLAELQRVLRDPAHLPAIVYCRTRQETEDIAAELQGAGLPAVAYHAGQSAETRSELQDAFLTNRHRILVATIAFGMGVDKPDVRSVVHYSLPSSPESYLQESGRAGRDGAPALSLVLLQGDDVTDARNRIRAAEPDAEGVLSALRRLLPPGRRVVSPWEITGCCDVPEEVITRALHRLTAAGVLAIEARGYQCYKVRPLFPLSTILAGRDAEEAARLRWLDAHREGEVEEAALAWGCSYTEAGQLLSDCEAAGEWRLTRRRRALELHTLRPQTDVRAEAAALSESFARRREADEHRLELLLRLLRSPEQLGTQLRAYFVDGSEPTAAPTLPPPERRSDAPIPPPDRELPAFAREAQRRRFLLGLSSPGSMVKRLWSHPLYGCCRGAAWDEL